MGLLPTKVDLIVSGVNPAANLGHDVTYSGTVTAVMEGIIWGVPGVAVSMDGGDADPNEIDYGCAVDVACQVVAALVANPLPKGTFLNVNVPDVTRAALQGTMLTRQGLRVYRDRLDRRVDPRGRDYYWIGGDRPTGLPKEGTDVGALADGYASVTPLKLDMTDYEALQSLASWQWPADWQSWLLIGACGLCGGLGHFFVALAHRYASAATLGPFLYQQIIYMTLLGWLVFGQVPDAMVAAGAMVVVASGLYLLWLEMRRR
jgi:hypothetical protein